MVDLIGVNYQDDFLIPIICPSPAACLKHILQRSNFLMNPRGRPQSLHLFSPRVFPTPFFPLLIILERSSLLFFAFAISDFLAICPKD